MRISYNEACARIQSSLEKDLVLCEKAEFDYIEIRLDMLQAYLEKHTVDELASFFRTSRIKPHAFNALYLYPEFLSENDDEDKRSALMNQFLMGCIVGKAIGSHYFIIVPPLQRNPKGGPYIGEWKDTYRDCVRILKKLSDIAAVYDMNLCFELVGFDRSSVRSVEQADLIVRGVDRDNVGFVFDSYNIYLNGGKNDFSGIRNVDPKKIFAAHLMSADDVPQSEMGQDKRCFPDHGAVDTGAFLKALKDSGYDGMVSVETFRPEYYEKTPEWVVENAYMTTYGALHKASCI